MDTTSWKLANFPDLNRFHGLSALNGSRESGRAAAVICYKFTPKWRRVSYGSKRSLESNHKSSLLSITCRDSERDRDIPDAATICIPSSMQDRPDIAPRRRRQIRDLIIPSPRVPLFCLRHFDERVLIFRIKPSSHISHLPGLSSE